MAADSGSGFLTVFDTSTAFVGFGVFGPGTGGGVSSAEEADASTDGLTGFAFGSEIVVSGFFVDFAGVSSIWGELGSSWTGGFGLAVSLEAFGLTPVSGFFACSQPQHPKRMPEIKKTNQT
jgi:hypothetical protein